jgi:hypothetical protein
MMRSASCFSVDYPGARATFLQAAREAAASTEAISHPERGPEGGQLATDVAWIGPRSAEAVLVMISATHGVEGFCGSGAQVDWLRREEHRRLPPGTAALIVHAINPYGFAWLRRVTHENVDLNRNWVDFDAPRKPNPGYEALAEVICPREWTAEAQERTGRALDAYAAEHGAVALQRALSGGQYSHAGGIYFGGDGPTWSRRTQSRIFDHYLAGARRVAIIDYHTGLGPWGYGEQILVEPRSSATFKRAARWYGAAITSPSADESSSVDVVGDGLSFAPRLLPKAEVTAMALEFGVQPIMAMLNALRADAWLHAHGDPLSPVGRAIKSELRGVFFDESEEWKGMVAGQSLLATRQAVRGLAA